MDNNAFRALLNYKGGGSASENKDETNAKNKTTKEIAREAVEEEFNERRKQQKDGRRRNRTNDGDNANDDILSSDDEIENRVKSKSDDNDDVEDGDDDEGNKKEPLWKQLHREKKRKKNPDGKNQYRDRAKERRKGLNIDYDGVLSTSEVGETAVTDMVDKDMSKYLGGDEAHTHLVRGLDLALAQKVRREEMQSNDRSGEVSANPEDDLDMLMEMDSSKKNLQHTKIVFKEQALSLILRRSKQQKHLSNLPLDYRQPKRDESSLATQCLVSYLSNRYCSKFTTNESGTSCRIASASLAGQTIQRSKHTFTIGQPIVPDIHDKLSTWELPKTNTVSKSQHDDYLLRREHNTGVAFSTLMSCLDQSFVRRIREALSESRGADHEKDDVARNKREKKKHKKKRKQENDEKNRINREKFPEDEVGGVSSKHRVSFNLDDITKGKERNIFSKTTDKIYTNCTDDEEDDIFADAGCDYLPPTTKANPSEIDSHKYNTNSVQKHSIFANLVGSDNNKKETDIHEKKSNETVKKTNSLSTKLTTTSKLPTISSSTGTSNQHSIKFSKRGQKRANKHNRAMIDRDILGARNFSANGTVTGSIQKSSTIDGYEGEYGEEMDVDFDGHIQEANEEEHLSAYGNDREKHHDKDDGLVTNASKEYGKRGKRIKSNTEDGGG